MVFVTKDQKAKTVMRILYERFISVFGACLLSCSVIEEQILLQHW